MDSFSSNFKCREKLNWQLMFCFPEEPPCKKNPKSKKPHTKIFQQDTKPKTTRQNNKTKTLQLLKRVGVLKRKNSNSNKSLVEWTSVPLESQ